MAAVKLQKFLGLAPKIAPEHLPETGAQVAEDIKFYSGDLIPYNTDINTDTVGFTFTNHGSDGVVNTLYYYPPEEGSSDTTGYWVAWERDTDVVSLPDGASTKGDLLFTDGVSRPQRTIERLAKGIEPGGFGSARSSYDAGVRLPDEVPIATAVPLEVLESTHYSRDDNNIATFYTEENHNLTAGNVITITDFDDQAGDFVDDTEEAERFNVKDVEVREEGLEDTEFTYFNPGDEVDKTENTTGRAELAGLTQLRTYVYTCVSLWGEESLPSPPSEAVRVKGGQAVAVTNLPARIYDKPGGNSGSSVRGIKLYRSVVTASATDYFLLDTLWFPITAYAVDRSEDVPYSPSDPEYVPSGRINDLSSIQGDRNNDFFQINFSDLFPSIRVAEDTIYIETLYKNSSGSSTLAAAITAKVAFSRAAGSHITARSMPDTRLSGARRRLSATRESLTRYNVAWRISFSFNTRTTLEATGDTASIYGLESGEYFDNLELPSGADILSSEDYDVPPTNMRGITIAHNNIYAGFFDEQLCLSVPNKPHAWPESYRIPIEETIVAIASVSGYIVVLTTGFPYLVTGNDPATMVSTRSDTFYPCLSKRSVVIMPYGVVWATHGGLATFSLNGGVKLVTGALHDWDTWALAVDIPTLIGHYYEGKYLGSHSRGAFVFERDDNSGGTFTDVSSSFTAIYTDTTNNRTLFIQPGGTDRLYSFDEESGRSRTFTWKSKVFVLKEPTNFGACKIVADYEARTVIVFKLYINRRAVPIKTINVSSEKVFRLPMGYRSDTLEIEVTSNVRIRSIHLAGTPSELRKV